MKHICEICNQQFNSAPEAEKCELQHKRAALAAEAQADTAAKINNAVNAYVAKYKALPEFDLTPENQEIVLESLIDTVGDTFTALLNLLSDDDDDDECGDCQRYDSHCEHCRE